MSNKEINLFIPRLGTILQLTQPWHFHLYLERRNLKLVEAITGIRYSLEDFHSIRSDMPLEIDEEVNKKDFYASYIDKKKLSYLEVVLPNRTLLKIDRVYIRQGGEAYDSITFKIPKVKGSCSNSKFLGSRFWVKLNDANRIMCEVVC